MVGNQENAGLEMDRLEKMSEPVVVIASAVDPISEVEGLRKIKGLRILHSVCDENDEGRKTKFG